IDVHAVRDATREIRTQDHRRQPTHRTTIDDRLAEMPATDWKEDIASDEADRFARYAALLGDLQSKDSGGKDRALHAKGFGVIGELEIANVPEEARAGMFAKPAKYPALVRFSNGAGKRQSDRTMDVRGIAVKVFGVDGKKLIPGMEDETTQDFLAIRTSALP